MAGKLATQIKKAKPFDSPRQEAFLNLLRTADALARPFDAIFKAAKLTSTQYNILRILRGAGPDGLACQECGRRMITRDPDITRLFDRLEARGLISRRRSGEDRRVVRATISRAGLELLAKLDKPVAALHEKQFARLTQARLRELSEMLELAREETEP